MQGADDHLITPDLLRRRGPLLAALWLLASCDDGRGPSALGGSDGPNDAGVAEVRPEVGDAAVEAPPAVPCGRTEDCPSDHFCGLASRTCVSDVVEVVAGAHHSCARHASGLVSCWGLAESIRGGGAAVLGAHPIRAVTGAERLAAGLHQTCATLGGGARGVRCWGNQELVVAGADGAPLTGVRQVAVGAGFGCVGSARGTFCWGKNDFGQLARPVEVMDSAEAVLSHPGEQAFMGAGIAVVTHDGGERLCAWGRNATKMISDSDADSVYREPQCRTVKDVTALAVGDTHVCVRHASGAFTCWGERYYGQLGIGGTETADVGPPGAAVTLPSGAAALAAGVSHTCALLGDASVVCFGRNNFGQVGPGALTPEEEVRQPVVVTGFAGKVVALGCGSSAQHTCAVLADGSVACWGNDADGQLGAGAVAREPGRFSAMPVAVRF